MKARSTSALRSPRDCRDLEAHDDGRDDCDRQNGWDRHSGADLGGLCAQPERVSLTYRGREHRTDTATMRPGGSKASTEALTMLIDDFKAWLEAEGYRPGTVRKTAADLASYLRNPSLATNPSSIQRARDYYRAWLLWEEYRESAGVGPIADREAPPQPQKPRRRVRRKRRKLDAESVSADDWKRLRTTVDADESAAAGALAVIMASGLRIADVLRVTRAQLDSAITRGEQSIRVEVKGGKTKIYPLLPEWRALLEQHKPTSTVAACVCPSGDPNPESDGPAYKAVARKLKQLGNKAGVTGRLHLHRLRRSVATQLIRKGASLDEVQRVLGHADIKTTQGYVDEQMADVVGKTLERLKDDE